MNIIILIEAVLLIAVGAALVLALFALRERGHRLRVAESTLWAHEAKARRARESLSASDVISTTATPATMFSGQWAWRVAGFDQMIEDLMDYERELTEDQRRALALIVASHRDALVANVRTESPEVKLT